MILITRPIDDAVELQKELKKKKISSLIDPLTSFEFQNRKLKFSDTHIYICASQRCVKSLVLINNKKNLNINIVVIGEKVARLLKQNNFKNILFIASNSKQLIDWMRKKSNNLNKYIYLSGNIVNNDFVRDLKKFKISYKRKIIYKTVLKKSFNKNILNGLKQNKIPNIIFYSATAVNVYFRLLKKHKALNILENQTFYVLSPRIADEFRKYNNRQYVIKISPKPEQSSMISMLIDIK